MMQSVQEDLLSQNRQEIFSRVANRDTPFGLIGITCCNENGIFFYENDNAIAFCCEFAPLGGMDSKQIESLQLVLDGDVPAGTMMQFIHMGQPVMDQVFSNYTAHRQNLSACRNLNPNVDHSAILASQYAVRDRAEFLRKGSKYPLLPNVDTVLTQTHCFFTVKVPLKVKEPFNSSNSKYIEFEAEVKELEKLRETLLSQLEVAGIKAVVMMEESVLALLRKYFKMNDPWDADYNEDVLLSDQIFPVGSKIQWNHKGFDTIHCSGFSESGERQNVGMLVIDRYPGKSSKHSTHLNKMFYLLGDVQGHGVQFGCPYVLTTTIHIPDQSKKATAFRGAQGFTLKQAKNPLLQALSPKLKYKQAGFEDMAKAMLQQGNIVEATTTLALFHSSKNKLNKALSSIIAYYKGHGFIMGRERYIHAVSFFNMLPMNATPESIKNTDRFKTMMGCHAVHLLPVLDESTGIYNEQGNEILLSTRRGRLFNYSLFSETNSNFNWTMIAGAGSGKSFFTQRLTQDHLSLGTKIWTIDTGSSYLAAARAAGAQIIDFDFNSQVCLNPFTKIQDINKEIDLIVPIIAKMAKPNDGVNDVERSILTEAIRSSYDRQENNANIDDVIKFLNNQTGDHAKIQQELGRLLAEFGSLGSMGRWFNGRNNFETEADWTVLELSGLTTNKHLCDVVLMMISTTISQEMFTKRDGRRKMLIIEEGGDRVTDPSFAEFVSRLYSKVRKENCSVGIVTQTFNQIYATKYGKSIMASAYTQFFMQQSPEDIKSAFGKGWLEVDEYTKYLLHECRTEKGRFSEVVVRSGKNSFLARLIETPFNRVLFSTEGDFFRELQYRVRNGEEITDLVKAEAERRYPEWSENHV